MSPSNRQSPLRIRNNVPESKPAVGPGIRGLALAFFVTLILAIMAVTRPTALKFTEFKIYDLFLRSSPESNVPALPVIVTLDEKAVRKFGQWPWPRYRVALLLQKIKRLGGLTIGLDMLFPEPDRTSPKVLVEQLERDLQVRAKVTGLPDELIDNDQLLARILANGPFIMGYVLLFEQSASSHKNCSLHPLKAAILSPKEEWDPDRHLISTKGVICSLKILGEAANSAGFINTLVDEDGIIRESPLLALDDAKIYPSLALATLMHATGSDQVLIKVAKDGQISLRMGHRIIPLNESGYFRIKYRTGKKVFHPISAADVLEDRIPGHQLQGKIVFVGTTAAGIGDIHATPLGTNFPGVFIQATIADNILSEQYIEIPPWTRGFQLMFMVLTGLLAWLLLLPGRPIWGLLVLLFGGAFIWWGSLWLFNTRSLYFSHFMPLLNLFTVFVLPALLNLRRAIFKSRTLKLAKLKADEVSRFKSDFLANMSHEIRTPMNAIIGLSHLALKTYLTAKQTDYLNGIQRSANSLLGIINDVLDFSKIEAGKLDMETVDFRLADVLDDLKSLIALKAEEKGLEFLFDTDFKAPAQLVGDPLRWGQILINLANNAVKFTEQGKVVVSLRLLEKDETHVFLQFAVEDTGIGLSREEADRLFQPFAQADRGTTRKYGGTGLGLSISRKLVEMMEGKIWLESEPGKGSTFRFTARFGLQSEKPHWESITNDPIREKQAESATQRALASIRGATILLVEDNEINQQVARELLEQQGLLVHVVSNGQEAVSALEQSTYDLVLTDIRMPIMDGYEATAQIRKNPDYKDLPIVAMTAQALAGDREKSLAAGMNDHISKPIDPERLFAVLGKWIQPGERLLSPTEPPQEPFSPPLSAPEDLPEINWSEGLARVAGNRILYEKLLHDFARQYGSVDSALQQCLDENDLEEMGNLIHTIKGTAGNLGANKLNDAARFLENALKNEHPLIEEALKNFDRCLTATLNAIANVVSETPPRHTLPKGNPDDDTAPTWKETETLIKELRKHIEASSLDADQAFDRLKLRLDGSRFREVIESLEQKLSDFDYEGALTELTRLSEQQGIGNRT
jgi:signal transduction histidine kinase/HPt (histidine-containing phosphotransfer) domain-containing protein/ActR/RegA family two-component response regulator